MHALAQRQDVKQGQIFLPKVHAVGMLRQLDVVVNDHERAGFVRTARRADQKVAINAAFAAVLNETNTTRKHVVELRQDVTLGCIDDRVDPGELGPQLLTNTVTGALMPLLAVAVSTKQYTGAAAVPEPAGALAAGTVSAEGRTPIVAPVVAVSAPPGAFALAATVGHAGNEMSPVVLSTS